MHLTIMIVILAAFGWTILSREGSEQGSQDDSEEYASLMEWGRRR